MAPTLFDPLQVGPLTLKNRIVMAPMTRNRSVGTIPNEVNAEYYAQRARGGASLIVTEGTLIVQQGSEWPYAPGIWNQAQIDGWKKVTDAVHKEGTPIFIQLWHLGRTSHPDAPEQKASGKPVYAPSAIAARFTTGMFRQLPGTPGYVTPTAVPDPRTIIAEYKQAAINAKAAGFDGVELQGGGGYLIAQFLDSGSNQRTDQWGGSVENRARFGLETLKAVIEVYGANRVAIKVAPVGGYNDVGMSLAETKETFSYYLKEVNKLHLAYVHLLQYAPALDEVIEGKPRATNHDVLGTYRHLITNSKFFLNGAITPEVGKELVESGKIDAVVFGQSWITHPDLAKRIKQGVPLSNAPDYAYYYGHGGEVADQRKGYTDYPEAAL